MKEREPEMIYIECLKHHRTQRKYWDIFLFYDLSFFFSPGTKFIIYNHNFKSNMASLITLLSTTLSTNFALK